MCLLFIEYVHASASFSFNTKNPNMQILKFLISHSQIADKQFLVD